jgi:hypothetical protein
MPKTSSTSGSRERTTSVHSVNSTQEERTVELPKIETAFKQAIKSIFFKTDTKNSDNKANELWAFIDKSYKNPSRKFHDQGHFSQLFEADLYSQVVSENIDTITKEEQIQILIAAYHDVVYAIDEGGIIEEIRQFTTDSEPIKFSDISLALTTKEDQKFRQEDINALATLFGIEEKTIFTVGEINSPNKLDGAPMNEFLSALEAMKQLAPNGVESLDPDQQRALLEVIVGIQMTVPFKEDHAVHLFESTKALVGTNDSPFSKLGLGNEDIAAIVNRAVDIANRDVGNFSQDTFLLKLLGDWAIQSEFDPKHETNENVDIQTLFNRITNTGFEDYVLTPKLKKHAVAQPKLTLDKNGKPLLDENGKPSLDLDDRDLQEQETNIAINIEASKISAVVMGAALANLYQYDIATKAKNNKSITAKITDKFNNITKRVVRSITPPTPKILASLKRDEINGEERLIEALQEERCVLPEHLKLVMLDLMENHSLDKITAIRDSVVTKDDNGKPGNTLSSDTTIITGTFSSRAGTYLESLIAETEYRTTNNLDRTSPPNAANKETGNSNTKHTGQQQNRQQEQPKPPQR